METQRQPEKELSFTEGFSGPGTKEVSKAPSVLLAILLKSLGMGREKRGWEGWGGVAGM